MLLVIFFGRKVKTQAMCCMYATDDHSKKMQKVLKCFYPKVKKKKQVNIQKRSYRSAA